MSTEEKTSCVIMGTPAPKKLPPSQKHRAPERPLPNSVCSEHFRRITYGEAAGGDEGVQLSSRGVQLSRTVTILAVCCSEISMLLTGDYSAKTHIGLHQKLSFYLPVSRALDH